MRREKRKTLLNLHIEVKRSYNKMLLKLHMHGGRVKGERGGEDWFTMLRGERGECVRERETPQKSLSRPQLAII